MVCVVWRHPLVLRGLLCRQLRNAGVEADLDRPDVERVRFRGLEIFDQQHVRAVHGEHDCDLLGTRMYRCGCVGHAAAPAALSNPVHRLGWTDLWRRAVLRHQLLRPLHDGCDVLKTGGLLLLVLLHLHELHLGRDPRQ